MSSDDAFELKAQALNNDPRLKAAGIAALKFVGDKRYVVDGDLSSELPDQVPAAAHPGSDAGKPDLHRTLHVFVRVPNDSSYELKAQALNQDSRLKKAGIVGLRFVGEEQFIVEGEFSSTIPTPGEPPPSIESEAEPSTPATRTDLHVFIRMKRDDSYKLIADYLNDDSRLKEVGVSDVGLAKGQDSGGTASPFPLEDREPASPPSRPAPASAPRRKRIFWGCLLGGILLGLIGVGALAAGYFLSNNRPVQPVPVVSSPTFTSSPQTIPSRTPRPTQTPDVAATAAYEDVFADVENYVENGYLASTRGELYLMDDHTLESADIGYFYADYENVYENVQNFAVWTDISWESASPVNPPDYAACGFSYRSQDNGDGYLAMLSNDHVGMLYFVGENSDYVQPPEYTLQLGDPAQARFSLVVNEDQAYVLVNDRLFGKYALLPDELKGPGSIYYELLSGSSEDYGTRCEFRNTRLWVSEP
jgi:hypothetical protein